MGLIRMIAVSAVLTVGLFQAGAASAQDRDVQIVRGGQTASIVETREARVRVYRGSPAATPVAFDSRTAGADPVVSSGSRVWFVDRAANTLSVCRMVKTTQVGEYRIDCQGRGLPR
jgi:hypothetical protein